MMGVSPHNLVAVNQIPVNSTSSRSFDDNREVVSKNDSEVRYDQLSC